MAEVKIPQPTRGWRMRMALESAGIGVSEMAEHLDYSRQSLTKWLHDDPNVRINRVLLERFAELCNVPVAWLMYGDERAPEDSNPQPSDLCIDGRYVLAA